MKTPQPDSPEQILLEFYLQARDDGITPYSAETKAQALTKLQEYYTNKFLEIVGGDEGLGRHKPRDQYDYDPPEIVRDNYRAELRQAIKQLRKEKINE